MFTFLFVFVSIFAQGFKRGSACCQDSCGCHPGNNVALVQVVPEALVLLVVLPVVVSLLLVVLVAVVLLVPVQVVVSLLLVELVARSAGRGEHCKHFQLALIICTSTPEFCSWTKTIAVHEAVYCAMSETTKQVGAFHLYLCLSLYLYLYLYEESVFVVV